MKVVIEISDKDYENFKFQVTHIGDDLQASPSGRAKYAIGTGTPLPTGHGDLIDRDDLLADSYCIDDWGGNEVNIVDVMTVKMADTIIEADTEREDKV